MGPGFEHIAVGRLQDSNKDAATVVMEIKPLTLKLCLSIDCTATNEL